MRALPVEDPGTPDRRSANRYLLWLAGTQARTLGVGAALGVLWMLFQALIPAAIGRAVDEGLTARDSGALTAWSGVLLALGAGQAVVGAFRHRLAVTNWMMSSFRTLQVVTRHATRLGATLPRRIGAGEVVSVGVADVVTIGSALDIVSRGSGAVVSIVVVAAILLFTSTPLGLVVLVGVPLILLAATPLLRPYRRAETAHRELVGELNTRATDLVAGLRVLRGIGGEDLFAGRYRAESQRVRDAGVGVARADSRLAGAEVLLPGLLIALVTWLGARFATSGTITPGQLVAFYGYAVFLILPLKTLGEAAGKVTLAQVAAGRVVALLAIDPELPAAGTVRAEPGELVDAASGVVAAPGRLTAIAAADPRDARDITERLAGMAHGPAGQARQGEASYGGVPLAELADLRGRILLAVNEDRLFSGPLHESLSTRGASREALERAVRTAAAEDIVEATGWDGHVAEAGREFSGGQRQRLRLARALAADPEVLILDEPTGAVDAHTEAAVADRLAAARAGRTTVVCTTSPLLLDRADEVVFVERGKAVATGDHHTLLDTHPAYAATVLR